MILQKCLTTLLLLLPFCTFSQSTKVKMSNKYNEANKTYDLLADNPFPGSTVLEVTFTENQNMSCTEGNIQFAKTIRRGNNTVATLKKQDPNRAINFRYTYKYFEGCKKTKPDFDHPYLIPLKEGSSTSVRKMTNLREQYGETSPPKDWYAITIKANELDTVFASRRGIVTKVEYGRKGTVTQGTSFTSERNWMSVQHKDCTIAKYQLFDNEGIWVKPGDMVEVGQPLGVISSENYTSGSHLRFSVTYFHPHAKLKSGIETDEKHYYAYVPVKFHTTEGVIQLEDSKEYEVTMAPEMVTIDMTKRELKKWRKNN